MTPGPPATPSRAALVRGWCPGVHEPMLSGDGWLVRARLGCRTVSAAQWRALGEAARRFGNGLVDLTSRGNVQLRGVDEPELGEVASLLVACGLAPGSAAADRARRVVTSPVAGWDPAAPCPSPDDLVAQLESALEDQRLSGLAAKWWAAVDDGGSWPLAGVPCDVRLRAVAGDGWAIEVAGQPLGLVDDPVGVVVAVASSSAAAGRRARDVDAGTWRRRLGTLRPAPPEPERSAWVGSRTMGATEVLVAAPFLGTCTAADLDALAELAEAHGAAVRPTTHRSVAVRPGPPSRAAACRAALEARGWIVEPGDRRAGLSACVGRRGCEASLIDTGAAARHLVARGVTVPTHLSGCAKACGAPAGVRHLIATGPRSFEEAP